MARYALLIAAVCLAAAGPIHGQVLRLAEHGTGLLEVRAEPGDTVHVDVSADLGRFAATGLTLFVRVPTDGFEVVGADDGAGPFLAGGLFDGAVVVRNQVLPPHETAGMDPDWQLLEYTALLGPGNERRRSGSGLVACFRLRCLDTASRQVQLYHSPVHESRLVLADGRTELPLLSSPPLLIRVDPPTAIRPASWAAVKVLAPTIRKAQLPHGD